MVVVGDYRPPRVRASKTSRRRCGCCNISASPPFLLLRVVHKNAETQDTELNREKVKVGLQFFEKKKKKHPHLSAIKLARERERKERSKRMTNYPSFFSNTVRGPPPPSKKGNSKMPRLSMMKISTTKSIIFYSSLKRKKKRAKEEIMMEKECSQTGNQGSKQAWVTRGEAKSMKVDYRNGSQLLFWGFKKVLSFRFRRDFQKLISWSLNWRFNIHEVKFQGCEVS